MIVRLRGFPFESPRSLSQAASRPANPGEG